MTNLAIAELMQKEPICSAGEAGAKISAITIKNLKSKKCQSCAIAANISAIAIKLRDQGEGFCNMMQHKGTQDFQRFSISAFIHNKPDPNQVCTQYDFAEAFASQKISQIEGMKERFDTQYLGVLTSQAQAACEKDPTANIERRIAGV